ncbi:MAG: sigma factor-like helix-turn-helix DNA-binding protein [Bacilli bacterium]|nr:sigma factor-like helix-turn-helix DNA-binding protein [Bacilli bacterium]MDD4808723.1 sigma factor-like helix-turn-helix DNA-binding protein [Bacilli bacterium]
MDNNFYIINLYDYYSELLTDKQKHYFESYYFNNLTLSEIAENNKISRNAVHKQIKDVVSKLETYETKLNLYQKRIKINKIINNLDETIKEQIKKLV